MITLSQVVMEVEGVSESEIRDWIAAEWVVAEAGDRDYRFTDMEVARIRLIRDMLRDMKVESETLPLVLSLLDQVYDLRRRLRCVAAAVREQPEEVRRDIDRTLRTLMGDGEI